MNPLAITGIGTISPLATGCEGLLAALDAHRGGLRRTELDPELEAMLLAAHVEPIDWAGRVLDFDYRPHIHPMKARRLDHASRMAVVAARLALADAGLASPAADGPGELDAQMAEGLAVMVGTSSSGSGPLTVFLEALLRQSPEAAPPFEFPNTVANAAAGHISLQLGLRGANSTLSHSEAVIAQTLLLGGLMIADERCSHLLAGSCDEWNSYYQAGYCQLGALRRAPLSGDGMLLGEGATLMVLEPSESATARGVHPIATLYGVAVGSASGEPFRWVANAERLEAVLRQALDDARLEPQEIGSVMLAANGVQAMEAAEAQALNRLFAGRRLPASGVKGALGERSVSGAVSVAVAALAQQRGQLPPYAGGTTDSWGDGIVPVSAVTPITEGATLVVLYGSGGNYGAVVVGA